MGGPGSGRWQSHVRADTVEDCRSFAVGDLIRRGCQPSVGVGSLTWRRGETELGSISFLIQPKENGWMLLRLLYTASERGTDQQEQVDQPVLLVTTHPHLGGMRWWFRCSLVKDGTPCLRRVGKLHLPPGAKRFGCRHCYELTYTSSQESHKMDRCFVQIADEIPGGTPESVARMFARLSERR